MYRSSAHNPPDASSMVASTSEAGVRRYPKGRFGRKLTLAVLVATIPAMLAGILILMGVSAAAVKSAADEKLSATAHRLERNVDDWIDDIARQLNFLNTHPDVTSMDSARMTPVLKQLHEIYPHLVAFTLVVNADGRSIAHSLGRSGLLYTDREWFRRVMAGEDLVRDVLLKSKTTGRPCVWQAKPIRDRDGRIVGAIGAGIHLSEISKAVGAARYGETGYSIVVDEKGRLLAHPDMKAESTMEDWSRVPPVAEVIKSRTASGHRYRDAKGSWWLAEAVPVHNGWSVVSFQQEGEAMAGVKEILGWGLGTMVVTSLIIVAMIWVAARHQVKPIVEMTGAAQAIAAGDWSRRLRENRRDELGVLSRAFNRMMNELAGTYYSVEEKVRQRTAELSAANADLQLQMKQRKRAEALVQRLSCVVQQTPASVVITDQQGRIEYVNPAFTRVTGYQPDEVLGQNPRILKSGQMPAEVYREMWQTLVSGREWRGEMQNRRKNGDVFWEWAIISPLMDEAGQITHYAAVKEDITLRKAMEDELRKAARIDKLTALPNRAMLCDRIEKAIERTKQAKGHQFAVLFLDFDRFKLINDSLGHGAGDAVLVEVAERLRRTVRGGDVVSCDHSGSTSARLGGDEFVILLEGIHGRNDAEQVAERVLNVLTEPYHLPGGDIFSTVSIGIVTSDMASLSAEEVLRDADTAMYEAKMAGKGRYVMFDASMRKRVQHRLSLESDMRRAVDGRQFFLMYQPIVSLSSGEPDGFEALVRWNHPDRGLIPPSEFIPVAEESGLILRLGEWVLEEACRQFMEWRKTDPATAPPSISVNLSRTQLMLSDLPSIVKGILDKTGMDASRLHLEITESAVMHDPQAAVAILVELKNLGVKLDLDDFGTGYSSLANLHQFPVNVLKVDRSFVVNVGRGRDFAALVHAVVQLATNLGISVVAEGIETVEQLQMLQALDCQCGQGYLFARPLAAHDVPGFKVDLNGEFRKTA